MLIILSPAKTMDMNTNGYIPAGTLPRFQKEADFIVSQMQTYTREQLQLLLQISNKLTDLNYKRYRDFDDPKLSPKPALLAYNGSVFQHIAPSTFTKEDYSYAQDHIRIISTLYGLIRPLDLIKAYRILSKIKIKGMQERNLYEYWFPKLTDPLIRDIQNAGGILMNLASLDVLGALNMDKLQTKIKIVTPEFKEFRKGKYETIRTYAKMARGEMTRYILLNRLDKPEDIRDFKWDGFHYCAELSDEQKYIFTK